MAGDIGVFLLRIGTPQIVQRFTRLAQLEQHPAVAVDDGGITGVGHACAVDQLQGLAIALGAVGQGVAQRIERRHIVRRDHQHTAQVGLGFVDLVLPLPHQCTRVQQLLIVRKRRKAPRKGIALGAGILVF